MTITPATMCVVLDVIGDSLLEPSEETIYIQLTKAHILHDNVVKNIYPVYTIIFMTIRRNLLTQSNLRYLICGNISALLYYSKLHC